MIKLMVSMANIDKGDLRRVDLNLLVAFEALMQARSVTGAAQRLRVGQPSASHALKRLRELFDDPLFVRTTGGMTPTPRALALAEPVRAILTSIETTLFSGPSFDPLRETRIFRIGATDYAQAVVAEPILATMRREAPGCRLILMATDCDVAGRSLERGEIDLAVGVFPEAIPATRTCVLYREHYECVFDAAACDLQPPLSRAEWLALPHMIMSTHGDYSGPLDDVLKAAAERREVMVSTPYFLAIPFLLRGKRLLATLPSRLVDMCQPPLGLTACAVPFEVPMFDVSMVWNARTAHEPGAVWLRDQIVAVCASVGLTTA
jgi:DNA-binding transcriptional LysR family regulator